MVTQFKEAGSMTWAMARGRALPLVAVLLLAGCAKEELVHGLNEYEANQIVVVLEKAGFKPLKEKEEGGRIVSYKVIVPAAEAPEAREILVNNNLPRPRGTGLGVVYDPANKGLIPTATEERAAYQLALQGEVVAKLKSIPGVIDAHVTIQRPDRDVVRELNERPPPATASVHVTFNRLGGKVPFNPEDLQRLVAACVEGMDPANVVVVASENRPMDRMVMGNKAGAEGGEHGGGAAAPVSAGVVWMGVTFGDEPALKKAKTMVMLAGGLSLVLFLALVLALVGFLSSRSSAAKANAMLASTAKARKAADEAAPPPG